VTKCRLWRLIKFFELEVAHRFQLQAIMTGRTKWGVSTSSKLEVAHLLGTSQKHSTAGKPTEGISGVRKLTLQPGAAAAATTA